MPTEETRPFPPLPDIPALAERRYLERWRKFQKHLEYQQKLKTPSEHPGIYKFDKRGQLRPWFGLDDPLVEAIENREIERAEAAAQIVVQGSLAYIHAEDFPFAVERFIPVDIYAQAQGTSDLGEVTLSLERLFRELGFSVVIHPDIAYSSTHSRAVIETRPMTPEELKKLEVSLSKALRYLDDPEGERASETGLFANLALQKDLAEIIKLQAETKKIETVDTQLTKAQIKQAEEETKKAVAERAASAADALNKLASALLKLTIAATLLIGGISLSSTPPDPHQPAPHATIQFQKANKESNVKRLGDFLERLAAQEEAAAKLGGGDE